MKNSAALALILGLTFGTAAVSQGLSGANVRSTYGDLKKPPWSPPGSLFGPVWTALYAAMSVAAWRVWRRHQDHDVKTTLCVYGLQLALNTAWSPIFFRARRYRAARNEMVLLLAAILATISRFGRIDRTAAGLLVPYALWVAFALSLNAAIVRLND